MRAFEKKKSVQTVCNELEKKGEKAGHRNIFSLKVK